MSVRKVSVVVPVYNVEQYVERALRSIAAQTYMGQLECIVVNDASPDGSLALVEKFIGEYQGNVAFKLVSHEQNRGLSVARNTGVEHSTGSHIVFLDSDDELPSYAIEALVALEAKYPGVDIVQGNLRPLEPNQEFLEISQYGFPEFSDDRRWIVDNMLHRIPVIACGKLLRRELFTECGLWFKPGIVHEDEHWRYIALPHIRSIAFTLEPTYIYHPNPASITTRQAKDRSYMSQLEIFSDYRPLIPRRSEYKFILLHTAEMAASDVLLLDRPEFLARLRKLWVEFAEAKSTPKAYRLAFAYAANPTKKNMLRMFMRLRSIRLLKRLHRIGLPF